MNPEELLGQLEELKRTLRQQTGKHLIMFLPYRASMWDSMASVYEACCREPSFETRVMPLPMLRAGTDGQLQMEIETDYPAEVPLSDCRKEDLSLIRPDAIFIHNPYDNNNLVTSVHPRFYSAELKKCTDCLVYVPYFASPWGLSEALKHLPSYENIDYWIGPSPAYKEGAKDTPYYDKIVPLGSPKYDRVIRLTREGVTAPPAWGELPEGKKRILISTTLEHLLADPERCFGNIECLFDILKERRDFVAVWRPHPLLSATLSAMKETPRYLQRWESLLDRFKAEHLGVLDETPDVSRAVAATDAYLDDGSSLLSLYIATEKPTRTLSGAGFSKEAAEAFFDEVVRGEGASDCIAAKEALSRWAANLDGTAGERIAAWLKGVLTGA